MVNQDNQGMVDPLPHMTTSTARVREFARINPPEFYGSKVDNYAQEFISEVYRILAIIGVTSEEKAEFVAYQLKGVDQVWFTQWVSERVGESPIG